MSSFPARHTVKLKRHGIVENSLGDKGPGYHDAVEVPVVAWYLTGGTERGPNGHIFQVEYDAVVLAPDNLKVSTHDRIQIPGYDGDFEVTAPPATWSDGPWWDPGNVQINLRKVE